MANEFLKPFSVTCPCCNGELLIDPETQSVLVHEAARPAAPLLDLKAEVERLQNAGAEREQAFQRSLQAERTREATMDRKFDELLRRARQTPGGKVVRDIDL